MALLEPPWGFWNPSEKALQRPKGSPFTRCFRSLPPTHMPRSSHALQVAGGSRGDEHINCNNPRRHAPRDSGRLLGPLTLTFWGCGGKGGGGR